MAVTGKKPSEWSAATIAAVQTATGINDKIENVVEDTTPQLGGDLDTQGNVIVGGTAVGSTLSLKSTTADGTLTAKALSVLTGNNGATEAVTVLNNGNVGIGNAAPALALQGYSTKANPFTIGAGTPSQEASSVAGNDLTLTASNAVAGSSNAGAAAGGSITLTGGTAAYLTSGSAAGGSINLVGGAGNGGSAYTGNGGSINLTGGAAANSFNQSGGNINITAGSGLQSDRYGGSVFITGGNGGTSGSNGSNGGVTISNGLLNVGDNASGTASEITIKTTNNPYRGSSNINIYTGTGGGANQPSGGSILISTGNQGTVTASAAYSFKSGDINCTIGIGSISNVTTGIGGNGGSFLVNGGAGGNAIHSTGGTGGNGSNIILTSGVGGNATGASGTRTGGNSGNITLDIGASGTGATANGTVGYVLLAPTRGNVGVGLTVPTAVLHIKAGTASASTAPLKFTSGTVNTAAETGAVEYDGTNLFFTREGTVREIVNTTLVKTDTGDATGAEGLFQINTFDNTFKVYADGGWRSLATWS